MVQYILYFFVAFFATLIGSIVGLGGGVIIKPVLDNLGTYSVDTIAFLSTCTVLAMAIVTTGLNQKKKLHPFTGESTYLIIGSLIGGYLGSTLFNMLLNNFSNQEVVAKIQALCLIAMLVVVVITKQFNLSFYVKRSAPNLIISGVLMGVIAAFLGIGGGPVNMAILLLCFKYPIKTASVLSTVTILFAQISSLLTTYVTSGFNNFNKEMLIVMIPAAIIGGMLGPFISTKVSDNKVNIMFITTLLVLIILNLNTLI